MATYVVPPASADFATLRQHGVLKTVFALGSNGAEARERLLTRCDDLGLLDALERFLAALAAEDKESARALRRQEPAIARTLRDSAQVWKRAGRSIGPVREKSIAHIKYVPAKGRRDEVLDALAEYLVDLWLDRRDRPADGGGA